MFAVAGASLRGAWWSQASDGTKWIYISREAPRPLSVVKPASVLYRGVRGEVFAVGVWVCSAGSAPRCSPQRRAYCIVKPSSVLYTGGGEKCLQLQVRRDAGVVWAGGLHSGRKVMVILGSVGGAGREGGFVLPFSFQWRREPECVGNFGFPRFPPGIFSWGGTGERMGSRCSLPCCLYIFLGGYLVLADMVMVGGWLLIVYMILGRVVLVFPGVRKGLDPSSYLVTAEVARVGLCQQQRGRQASYEEDVLFYLSRESGLCVCVSSPCASRSSVLPVPLDDGTHLGVVLLLQPVWPGRRRTINIYIYSPGNGVLWGYGRAWVRSSLPLISGCCWQ